MRSSICLLIIATVFPGSTHLAAQETKNTPELSSAARPQTDLTVNASIAEVVANRPSGSPQGTHLLVRSSMQTLDVSVGPYLSPALKKQMSEGSTIQITGFMESAGGKNYLMAREVVLGGQKYTIRNQNGFLVHNSSNSQPGLRRPHGEQVGGAN